MASCNHYHNFSELIREQAEKKDWDRLLVDRNASVIIIAPHGGGIEAGTSELAKAIAGEDFSLYCFEGLRIKGNAVLHVSSTRFDDPLCLDLLSKSAMAISLHGCAGQAEVVYVGGLHTKIRQKVSKSLLAAGFCAIDDCTIHNGDHPANLCNRCLGGRGVQLELSRGLRARLFAGLRASERQITTRDFDSFVSAVRKELLAMGTERSNLASGVPTDST